MSKLHQDNTNKVDPALDTPLPSKEVHSLPTTPTAAIEEKLEKVGKGLDSVQRDTQSVNAKVEALGRERLERRERPKRVRGDSRREKLDSKKGKIPPFLGNGKPESYLNWELKVDKILEIFDYSERRKRLMRERFVSFDCTRDLYNKLQMKPYPSSSEKSKERGENRPRKDKSPKKGSEPLSSRKEDKTPTI
ncbi:hypothetical protein CR513_11083, partial [Mucuna pruriens]